MKIWEKIKEKRIRSETSKKRWLDTIENDMRAVSKCVEDVED